MKITRKMDLSTYGLRFENFDLESSEHPTWEECFKEVDVARKMIHEGLTKRRAEMLETLNHQQSLNPQEQELKEKLEKLTNLPPF